MWRIEIHKQKIELSTFQAEKRTKAKVKGWEMANNPGKPKCILVSRRFAIVGMSVLPKFIC
jgi:hypothetical protein